MKARITANMTEAQYQAMRFEARKAVAAANEEYERQFDALILWTLHREFGFGKKRLRRVYEAFRAEYAELSKAYRMKGTEMPVLYAYLLKKHCDIDIDAWTAEVYGDQND